jgi:D-amino-acid dehydrogenase
MGIFETDSGMPGEGPRCIVVGAGIVGSSCAWFLQRRGARVTLVDPVLPGQSTSFGNAGCISMTSVFPFSVPGVIRKVPSWLMDAEGPLRIRWSQLPSVLPWLYRFWRSGSAQRVQQIVEAQSALMQTVLRDFDDLLRGTESEFLRETRGAILLYESEKAFAADAWKYRERDRLGLEWRRLSPKEVGSMEPRVRLNGGVALFEPLWQHVTDPGGLTGRIADAAVARGAQYLQDRVSGVAAEGSAVRVSTVSGRRLEADRVVLATGVWSNALLKPLGYRVPLAAKRGYHVMYARPAVDLNFPVMSASRHVVLTPMRHGLRVAGTAEFAAVDAPPDFARADALIASARHFLPDLGGDGVSQWMGQRPMTPDSIPVLGALPRHPAVLCALGHGHYGLTQGPATGRIISDLVFGADPGLDLSPFSITRF